jgi:acyl phosphate:glycerol-3-phosphate acyltransferase
METSGGKMAWLVVVISYLLGSIPTAYIAGRLIHGQDIRQMGDSNMGAANAYRQLGARVGIVVGIIDSAKGALAVLIAHAANLPVIWVLIVGIAAVIGHNWPVFLGFRGGRGVSTTIGVLLVTVTIPILIMAGPCIIALLLTRNVTKSMVVLFVPLSALGWWLDLSGLLIGFSILLPVIVAVTHWLRVREPAHLNP